MANYYARGISNGLVTYNMAVPEAGTYKLKGSIDLPTIPEGESTNSQVVVTITINSGSAVYTGPLGSKGFEFTSARSANDIFNITLSSSAPIDQGLNKIKLNLALSEQ